MTWLSAQETDDKIQEMPDSVRLLQVFALSMFANKAHYSQSSAISMGWEDAVKLTELGSSLYSRIRDAEVFTSGNVGHFTLFRLFYHTDLLVDYQKTDTQRLLALLNEMASTASARWPYVYGRILYDRFNDTYRGNRTRTLEAAAVDALLAGSPQGVFQVGSLVSGPLGLMESIESRMVPPTLEVALWHCSDPGCSSKHYIKFEQYELEPERILKACIRFLLDQCGPPSEWKGPISRLANGGRWSHGRPYADLPALLADCLIGEERRMLCLRALRSRHNARLSCAASAVCGANMDPEQICDNLTTEQQHQLLLLLPDEDIVEFLDELVNSRQIKVPPSEIRLAKTYRPKSSWDFNCRFSSLGVGSTDHPPIVELAGNIWTTYKNLGETENLAWCVRDHAGVTPEHRLYDYLREHGPDTAIRELILPSRAVSQKVAEQLSIKIREDESEESLVNRFLWKLGFSVSCFEECYSLLRTRISEFRDSILSVSSQLTETDRARIRGIGVNLFVSVEEFLEDLLIYNYWLVSSDHFLETRFCYQRRIALSKVGIGLGESIQSGTETLQWRSSGHNTLGTVLAYFDRFRTWLSTLENVDKNDLLRDQADYPHYAKDTLYEFPFKHTALWADSDPNVLHQYAETLKTVASQLAQADLCSIRNAIDHKRAEEEFPGPDRLNSCVARLQQALEVADRNRLVPKFYWTTRCDIDGNGNTSFALRDYRASETKLLLPSPVCGCVGPKFNCPFIIAPFDFLSKPNSTLLFTVKEHSAYEEYWKNYPRRRHIPPTLGKRGVQNPDECEGEPLH